MRALVTNDDGIESVGLHRLAEAAADAGFDVVVAAPGKDSSGASASLTAVRADGRVMVERRTLDDVPGVTAYAVGATPAFITLLATRGAFGPPPDVVLSGINLGHNAGQAVLHSGTVGAALTAAAQGCRGMAVSTAVAEVPHWDTAAAAARGLLPWLAERAPARTALNVNAPDAAPAAVRGYRTASLATFGAVQANVEEAGRGYVRVQMAAVESADEPGTDAALLADGWVTLTLLQPICEADASALLDMAPASP